MEQKLSALQVYQSPCLLLIQERLQAYPRSQVLDLGSFTNTKLDYLSHSRCKLEALNLSKHTQYRWQPSLEAPAYDIILCWDLLNYLAQDELTTLLTYLDQHSKKNTLLYFFTRNQAKMPNHPVEFQLFLPNALSITMNAEKETECPRYSATFIKKILPRFYSERACLLKNGLQENVWIKSPLDVL